MPLINTKKLPVKYFIRNGKNKKDLLVNSIKPVAAGNVSYG
jgi:hypothetical protein